MKKWIMWIYVDLAFFTLFIFVGVPYCMFVHHDPWMALIAVLCSLGPLYDAYRRLSGRRLH